MPPGSVVAKRSERPTQEICSPVQVADETPRLIRDYTLCCIPFAPHLRRLLLYRSSQLKLDCLEQPYHSFDAKIWLLRYDAYVFIPNETIYN